MYEQLRGKRLLIVGSAVNVISMIETAHELGIYVVVVDGRSNWDEAPAKKYADEGWDIDYQNTDEIVAKCRECGITGVMTGYSEFWVLAACRIAKGLGVPFYATEEQIKLTRNKRVFKDTCQKYGVKIPKDYCFAYPVSEEEKNSIEFPVIVKPADYGGRKGITVCETREQLDPAIEYAVSKSESNTIIIEEYLEGTEFNAIYTIADGNISLSCLNEKYITGDQKRKTGLCDFVLTPAFFIDEFIEQADQPIKNFLNGIGAENGAAFFQGMYTSKGVYVFEMGYRVNGNNDFNVVEDNNGVNFLKMLFNHTLTGSMGDGIEKDNPRFSGFTASLPINVHAGCVSRVDYSALGQRTNFYDIDCMIAPGNVVVEDGSTHQKAMLLKIKADSIEELNELYDFAISNIIIEDENGKDMKFKPFDFENVIVNHLKR